MPHPRRHITVVGGGFAGLTAAISAAEAGADVTLHEAHRSLGGRARTDEAPYRTNEGPHALYARGPHYPWLKQRGLLGPLAPLGLREAARIRFHHHGELHRVPPLALLRLRNRTDAPVGQDFLSWASAQVGEPAARAAAYYTGVATFHHDPGLLSAAFTHRILYRTTRLSPEARYIKGGWGALISRMADHARGLGVRIETGSRVDALPEDRPVIVATQLDSARALLGDDALTWSSARTVLVDLALREQHPKKRRATGRRRATDLFVVSDLDHSGWIERFTAQDPTLAPPGEQLLQGQVGIAPHETRADGLARAERLLDAGFPEWRERVTWRRDALATGRTGAVDLPGTTWRDRPAIDRGNGVYLAGDQVAAPGVLSEVAFTSAIEATALALSAARAATRARRMAP
ncbi:FAD-dependent oxidoreductase [Streptomyces purpurogeneiscleroticus]|uniref:FAD-dependent oxidoreductase n=1 Tax=Streptomyces purpurogeneiscleroticus TaxID=68259 RepID=UPI001CBFEF28|nr:FAD-dependent oxidoreductase [Streptomyces purpurogeneiscleroticus]MBZ4020525.1 FAD-dependent oxidoreductase [Streptomyces purpurogeneiscleroticus]